MKDIQNTQPVSSPQQKLNLMQKKPDQLRVHLPQSIDRIRSLQNLKKDEEIAEVKAPDFFTKQTNMNDSKSNNNINSDPVLN